MVEQVQAERHPLASAEEVEHELNELWREIGTSDTPMMRARVLTLITVTNAKRESEFAELLSQVSERHPARNLLVLIGEDGEDIFDASATIICGMNERALCAEQIHLHASGAGRWRLASAIRSLLTPTLPVVLWWTLSPAAHIELFRSIEPLADFTLLDSRQLQDVQELQLLLEEPYIRASDDLNWDRLATWRDLIAGFFDAPNDRELVERIDEVHIAAGRSTVESWLLVGWLASRLGWKRCRRTNNHVVFGRGGGEDVAVYLSTDAEAEGIQQVRLRAGDKWFEVKRVGKRIAECRVSLPDGVSTSQVVRLEDESQAALLSRELDMMARSSSAYRDSLAIASQIQGMV